MNYKDLTFEKDAVFLVTGGLGFIGTNLCEAILDMGYRVRTFDDLSTGRPAHAAQLLENPNFEYLEGNILEYGDCIDACRGADYVLHQASRKNLDLPLYYEKVNIRGTLNMLEAARQIGVKKFVYASSHSVYGDHPALPRLEGQEGNVLSTYALTKKVDEEYAKLYTRLHGLDTYGLRYFSVFGRRQRFDGPDAAVIPKFISQLLQDKAPTINGDGRQSRDFTYIDNVIDANLKACKADSSAAGEVYNIACGQQEQLIDVYNAICKALGKTIEPSFAPEIPGEIKHSFADITKARKLLGYDPQYDFESGLKLTIEWYQKALGGN